MRSLVLVLLMAAAAHAEPLVRIGGYTHYRGGPMPSGDLRLEFHFYDGFTSSIVTAADPIPLLASEEPQIFTIDATNAASFGLDWQAAHDVLYTGFDADPLHVQVRSGTTSTTGSLPLLGPLWSRNPRSRVIEFDLHRIEYGPAYWFSSPIGSIEEHSIKFFGDGRIVPEPGTLLLAIMALGLVHRAGRSRSRLG